MSLYVDIMMLAREAKTDKCVKFVNDKNKLIKKYPRDLESRLKASHKLLDKLLADPEVPSEFKRYASIHVSINADSTVACRKMFDTTQ